MAEIYAGGMHCIRLRLYGHYIKALEFVKYHMCLSVYDICCLISTAVRLSLACFVSHDKALIQALMAPKWQSFLILGILRQHNFDLTIDLALAILFFCVCCYCMRDRPAPCQGVVCRSLPAVGDVFIGRKYTFDKLRATWFAMCILSKRTPFPPV